MRTQPTPPADVRQRITQKLRDRDAKAQSCPKHKLYEKLQQMSLLSRLFDKEVCIETDEEQITSPVYLATPRAVILRDGKIIPLAAIRNVNIC